MPTLANIGYKHAYDGFSKGIDQGGGPFIRLIYIIEDWNSTDAFCNALMGFGTMTGPITGPTVTRGVPHRHPQSPNLTCQSATVIQGLGEPILSAEGLPNYSGGALIAAEYRPAPWNFAGGENPNHNIDPDTPLTWCTQELDHTTSVFTFSGLGLSFTSTGKPSDAPAKLEVPLTIMTLTFVNLPYLPVSAVRACRGRINDATFLGSPAGCVLFKGAKTERKFNTDGSVVQQVILTFEERNSNQKWNWLPSSSDLTFRDVAWEPVPGTFVRMFEIVDMSQLLLF